MSFVSTKSSGMIQLYIPLAGLITVVAYYLLSFVLRPLRRLKRLKKLRRENIAGSSNTLYYKWELHELI